MAMSKRSSKIRYSKLSSGRAFVRLQDEDDEVDVYSEDLYYTERPDKPPIKSIVLAILLFLIGSTLLTIGGLMIGGILGGDSGSAVPLLILGGITFLPGFYHVRLAFYAWKGYLGYSYRDIPGYD